MKKTFLVFSLLLLQFPFLLTAQTVTDLKGVVLNEQHKPSEFATAVLLEAKDSVMQSFALTDKNGNFNLSDAPKGDYILQITFVGYKTFLKNISVDGLQKEIHIDTISLEKNSNDLKEVIVQGDKIPIQLKGDTVEYNADAFKTQPNADVEALLKKLPGVEVDKDGNIKAQGETVKKITVDGKDFFTDDPKMATKNLPADAIDKVQVYNKKSETSEFTGVDDGETEKTINLTLKDNKKTGKFGSVTVGGGKQDEMSTDARYYGKLSYNKFSAKNKFSLIGLANNTNEQGFTFQDISSFSGGMQNVWDNNFFGRNNDAGSLSGSGQGISDNLAGGMNLNNSAVKNLELNLNYVYSYTNNVLDQNSKKNYFGLENNFISSTTSYQQLFNHNHRANLKAVYKFSENSNLTLKSNMNYTAADKNILSIQGNFVSAEQLNNSSTSDSKTNSNGLNIKNNLIFKQKFKKVGRTFVFDGSFNWRAYNSTGNLNSSQTTYDTSVGFITKHILQNQLSDNPRNTLALKFTYTEPLTTESVLEFGYVHQNSLNGTKKTFYDITSNTEIKVLNDSLSSDYNNQYSFDKGGIKLRYNKGNTNFAVGVTVQNSLLNGTSQKSDLPIKKNFLKTLPSLSLVQKFDHAGRLNFNYQAKVNEPSIDQLQPVIDNTNPLAIYIGNPNLDAEYQHTLNLNYNYFSQYSSTSLFIYTYTTYGTGHIINAVTFDSSFVQTTEPVNSKYQFYTSLYPSFSTPIKFLGVKIGLEPGGEYTDGLIFINGRQTGTKTYSTDVDVSLENKKKDAIDWTIGTAYTFNQTKYAGNASASQKYFSWDYYVELEEDFSDAFTLSSDFHYNIYNNSSFTAQQVIPIWNAYLSFQFLKNDRGELKLGAHDILNKENGLTQTAYQNYTEQKTVNTLGRYYLLTFAYNLSKLGKNSNQPQFKMGGMH